MKMSCITVGFYLCLCQAVVAQVGINTIDPQAQLDIASSSAVSPEITDGILIPRIENFPAKQPTSAQDGMLVYLKRELQDHPKGFYYWEAGKSKWESMTASSNFNFFTEGTSQPAVGVTESIYRTGNIGIGGESSDGRFKVFLGPETDHAIRTAVEIDNYSSSPQNVTYGILNNNRSLTNSRKYGIKNNVSAAGKGIHYGIYNEVYQSSVEDIYGIYNKVGRTYGVDKKHYGIYTEIGTSLGTGYAYGLFSTAFGNNSERVYAGYFAGRVGIGITPENQYIFPAQRGKKNQSLSLEEDGKLNWKYASRMGYSSTGSKTGNYTIEEDAFTLRINNQVSSVIIPTASLNEGRTLVLLGWNGISTKSFVFSTGEDIWDVTTASSVKNISSGERLTIQSDGSRWIVLNRQ